MGQYRAWTVGLILIAIPGILVGQSGRPRPKRARPPQWDRVETERIFYRDAFKEGLIGKRPSSLDFSGGSPDSNGATSPLRTELSNKDGASAFSWSRVISASTIEDEVKRLKPQVDATVTTPGRFAESGYLAARQQFAVLAVLFAIVDEYDAPVRWKNDSTAARGLFASAARICQAGTDEAYTVAHARKSDLQDLVGGAGLQPTSKQETAAGWAEAELRPPLMQRFKTAHEANLSRWVATESKFARDNDRIVHEAEIIAALSVALTRDGMPDSDDGDYTELCQRLEALANRIVDGARTNSYERSREAVGEMGKTCGECHETYR